MTSRVKLIQSIRALATAAVVVASSGCFTMNAAVPGTLRSDVESTDVDRVGTLNVEKTNFFFFWGLVGAPDKTFFQEELKQQVAANNGDGVANLRYEAQEGCVSLIIGGITCGIVAPRDYKLSGDIVRIKVPTVAGGANQPLPPPPASAGDAAPITAY